MYKKYLPPALFVFGAAVILIKLDAALYFGGKLIKILIPILMGVIFAAVADPAVEKTKGLLQKIFGRLFRKPGALSSKGTLYAAIFIVYMLILGAAVGVVCYIIPQLSESVKLFAASFDDYYRSFRQRYDILASRDPFGILVRLDDVITSLADKAPELLRQTYDVTASFISAVANTVLGLVISIYLLASKESILEFAKGWLSSAMSEKSYKKTVHVICTVNSSFVNFISGQLTEAVILGTLCFAGMIVFDFEYPLLISTVIGVTALIPVVGAFAGAVPSALLLFLVKPASALWFAVFIIILQQLENNLIYPKVVGKSVGLPPVLILTAIIAGAELGGAAGILLGIPILSAAYTLAKESIAEKAKKP
ncbi:MAG: AI-2E family transporter [Huintestinicola sp.]